MQENGLRIFGSAPKFFILWQKKGDYSMDFIGGRGCRLAHRRGLRALDANEGMLRTADELIRSYRGDLVVEGFFWPSEDPDVSLLR